MSYDDFPDTEVMGLDEREPWMYAFEGGTAAYIVERDGTTVARLSVVENSTGHRELAKNARLMAAAPDMLNALQAALAAFEEMDRCDVAVKCTVECAIERATGSAA